MKNKLEKQKRSIVINIEKKEVCEAIVSLYAHVTLCLQKN